MGSCPSIQQFDLNLFTAHTEEKGVRLSASASGSQPSGNTRNDKILQTPSSNSKNKKSKKHDISDLYIGCDEYYEKVGIFSCTISCTLSTAQNGVVEERNDANEQPYYSASDSIPLIGCYSYNCALPDHQVSVHHSKGTKDLHFRNISVNMALNLVTQWILPWWRNPNWMRIKKGKLLIHHHYRGMIGTLLYLTASRPDLQFAICMCARYQARPTEKHLHAVKRIFRYLKGTVHGGLWYRRILPLALTAFADEDHAGC
ncbi:hypothetical protein Tco_0709912 [Tanacetum coccineum]|uniref:Reverse transcriptase Ty1/copia-type domain-containing protein n=1 Tax=Tanacetum coccineum TaxID=301880 RepID=A0ABQ5HGW7_9ASTR